MPANLTPEYRKAEALYRQASGTEEKVTALELMLQVIPKHKGTDHMQADIKRRLAKLKTAGGTGKGAARQGDVFHVPKGAAAGQVVLLGTPNVGKSDLVAHLTNAHVQVADFPFSTHGPVPGILLYEDVRIQLVDMPPITREHVEPGQTNAYRQCDLIMVVVDLSAADVTEQLEVCLDFLHERTLIVPPSADGQEDLYKRMARPSFCVATKGELASEGDFKVLKDMYGAHFEMMVVSVKQPESLKRLGRKIFEKLGIVRVYSKHPGKEADMSEPFTLRAGATVQDLAYKVHRELAEKLRFARGWGRDKYPGQQVPRDYPLCDKDVIELHFG
ncbi:MAG: 50S ribosome-binding GTPase [Sedimentisphaerales bacterium]|nr:50S ribosome-binding GTPase [Sedimentisphaerales bacterium]